MSPAFPYGLKYDETDPSVTDALPERAANAVGWFNRPIGFDVQGTDATSGIAHCPSVTYTGPDSVAARLHRHLYGQRRQRRRVPSR